ncbi:MAG TPA: sigma 54-interacting transcriptional regulator [Acidobacteriaceae bacterium]|nr:sigma 54-interacting transcriptional regulator [Acidobacteriaceae bacterium]
MARLVAISGPLASSVHELRDGEIAIGRDPANDLCLPDRIVSRRHCRIRQVDDGYELADLDSHNGTFINGVPVRSKSIGHGDRIRVGHSELVFMVHSEENAMAALADDDTRMLSRPVRLEAEAMRWSGVEVGRMARDLAALFRISNVISEVRDLDALRRELLQLIFEVAPAEQGVIVMMGGEDEPESVTTYGRDGGEPRISVPRELVHRALWEKTGMLADREEGGRPGNVLCMPLVGAEHALGAVYLVSLAGVTFTEDDIHLLSPICRIAAVTLESRLAMEALRRQNQEMSEEIHATQMVGESRRVAAVKDFIARVAPGDSTVLIRGESGTGKELVARAIHQRSPRAERPFLAINCAAIPEALLESELFGHERGAFTGAANTRKGKLEVVEDGTLFLDEIGEMAPLLQAKLLRVLQEKEFERLGGTRPLNFRARVVAATNRDLEAAIKAGEFRQDLYYRLNVVSVTVPPLRERREDIPLLALFFANKYAARCKRPFTGVSAEARKLLLNYSWPGNIRELENAIEHAMVLGVTENLLPEDLPSAVLEGQAEPLDGSSYHAVVNRAKRELIADALEKTQNRYPEAARMLGIHPKYLHRLARNLGIKGAETG